MLNRRLFNAIVGTIPFVGIGSQEQKNELAEYILNKISKHSSIEEIKAIGIEWFHYSVKGPTWFCFQLKDKWNTRIWAMIPSEFDISTNNLIEVCKIMEDKNIECSLIVMSGEDYNTNKKWYRV